MLPPGTSSSPFQIPVSTNYLGSPPTRSTGMSSSSLQVLVSPLSLGSPPTHQTSPQPHEPLDSYVSPISTSIQTSTVSPNPLPHPPLIESLDHLASVEHSHVHHIVTRSQTGHSRPRQFPNYVTHYSSRHVLHLFYTVAIPPEPNTFTQAASKLEWRATMESEFKALLKNDTLSLCPRPSSHYIVRNKWVYKIKQKPDGSIDCYKARLVAKGFDQKSGVDYFETFSLVVKTTTVRLILALVVQFRWTTRQLDVSNAFLQGYLDEEVYMEQPKGFISAEHPNFVC